jgi:hypothetical protein
MNEQDVQKEVAEVLVVSGLSQLVRLGRICPNDVNHKWYIEFNDSKLEGHSFAGAATIDRNNRAVLYLHSRLTIDGMLMVIAHEVVHLAQICKGDLIPMYGFQIWKGKEYISLPADSPDYFKAQPWEKEAREFEPLLLEYLKSKIAP